MADVKWIKITTNMFDNSKIKQLRALPSGDSIVLLWIMLLTMAGKCNAGGMLILSENIPYTLEMLATELNFDIQTLEFAIRSLEKFGMIKTDEGCLEIKNWTEYQNEAKLSEIREYEAQRKNEYRKKKKCLGQISDKSTDSSISISNSESDSLSSIYKEIIDYLNTKTNSRYRYQSTSTQGKIKARLNEGFTVDDFKTVIDKKVADWLKKPDMVQYLRPETLFGTKFESYLNQSTATETDSRQAYIDKWANV